LQQCARDQILDPSPLVVRHSELTRARPAEPFRSAHGTASPWQRSIRA
jgi:hypothetical protein